MWLLLGLFWVLFLRADLVLCVMLWSLYREVNMGTADWRRYVDGESTAETSRWLQKKKKNGQNLKDALKNDERWQINKRNRTLTHQLSIGYFKTIKTKIGESTRRNNILCTFGLRKHQGFLLCSIVVVIKTLITLRMELAIWVAAIEDSFVEIFGNETEQFDSSMMRSLIKLLYIQEDRRSVC